jgi:hypothetical protein
MILPAILNARRNQGPPLAGGRSLNVAPSRVRVPLTTTPWRVRMRLSRELVPTLQEDLAGSHGKARIERERLPGRATPEERFP